jgi:hypothetical protein
MLTGKRHTWCGKINWFGIEECSCPAFNWPTEYKERINYTDQFETVTLDNPVLESLAEKAKKLANALSLVVTIGFDPDFENVEGELKGALIIDGYIYVYPEEIVTDSLVGVVKNNGYALDVEIVHNNYPHEPDDVDYNRIITSAYDLTILSKAFQIVWETKLNYVIEGMVMDEEFKEDMKDILKT